MRVTAGKSEVVGMRATFADRDCDAHPSNFGTDTQHQADDELGDPRLELLDRPATLDAPTSSRCWRYRWRRRMPPVAGYSEPLIGAVFRDGRSP